MTVVPRSAGAAVLICNRCGAEDQVAGSVTDSDVVWPLVATAGWTGSPFATGRHICSRCGEDAVPEFSVPVHGPSSPALGASYAVSSHDDVAVTVLTPLVDIDAGFVEVLRDGLNAALGARPHVMLDLHAVHLIDSMGLGALVRAHQEAKRGGGSLSLIAPSRFLLTVLHTMRLDALFPVYPDEQTALTVLSTGGLSSGRGEGNEAMGTAACKPSLPDLRERR